MRSCRRRPMKVALLLLTAGLVLSCFACARKNWQTINENGFSVEMPGVPARNQQTAPTPAGQITNYTYSVELKNEAYTVAFAEYPAAAVEKLTDTEKFLDNGRAGAIASFNGALTEEHPLKLSNYSGREFSADAKNKDATVTDRIYWAPPRVYQVIYERPKGTPLTGDGKKFLDSFSIEPVTPNAPAPSAAPSSTTAPASPTAPAPSAAPSLTTAPASTTAPAPSAAPPSPTA